MKVSLKNWVSVRLGARAAKQDQWQVDNDLVFSGDNLEPRVLLSAVAVADVPDVSIAVDDTAIVQEDDVFDSTDDGLNGGDDTSVVDNDLVDILADSDLGDVEVSAISSSVNGLNGLLGLDSSSVDFNSDGTFTFDGTASDVIQSLSEGEVGTFNFEYNFNQPLGLADAEVGRVNLQVQGANDVFEVTFADQDFEYVVDGNAIEFDAPLAQISDVDANDSYSVILEVEHTSPSNDIPGNPLGTLFLNSEGEDTGVTTLVLTGTLDEINAQLEDVRFKPDTNVDRDLAPEKYEQQISIIAREFPGADDANPSNVLEGTVLLTPVLDGSGNVVFNEAPVANEDGISFNENGSVDFRIGNLLDNDTDADGDALTVTDLSFEGQLAAEFVVPTNVQGVDYSFQSVGNFGVLYFNEDGSYIYEFDDDVDSLAFSEQVSDEFQYNIIDTAWNENVGPGTLKVTINGANDAPEFQSVDGFVHENSSLPSGEFLVEDNHGTVVNDGGNVGNSGGNIGNNDGAGGGIVTFDPADSDFDAAVVAASLEIDEQATPVPIELDLEAILTDLDASDVHDIQINGVFVDGEVAPGLSPGDFKTDGTFFDFLSVSEVDNDDPANRVVTLDFAADASALNYLDEGDVLYLIYQISATDPHDAEATAFVKVKITGTEDKPFLWVEDSGTVTEGDLGDDPIIATGILVVDGVDEDDRSTFLPNNDYGSGLVGTYGSLEIAVDENGLESFVYTLDNDSDIVQALNEGEVVQDTFSLSIFDNGEVLQARDSSGNLLFEADGTTPIPHLVHITIDVVGTDDEPVITYLPAEVAEGDVGHPTFVEGIVTITDIDSLDNPTFATNPLQPGSGTGVGTFGEITGVVQIPNPDHDPEDSSSPEFLEVYTYVPNQEAIQFLAAGEELTDVVVLTAFDFTLTDEHGDVIVRELATKAVDIVIKGTNDAPEVTSDVVNAWEDPDKDTVGAAVIAGGTLNVSDVDLSDEVFVEAEAAGVSVVFQREATGSGSSFESLPFPGLINAFDSVNTDIDGVRETLLSYLTLPEGAVVAAGDETGVIEWTFDSGTEGFDFLARDERLVIFYRATVTDSEGASAEAIIRVNVLGKNDRPDIFVGEHDSAFEVLKEASSSNDNGQDADGYFVSGTLSVSDVDAADAVLAFEGLGLGVTSVVVESTNPIPPDTGLSNADFLEMLSLLDATTVVGVSETEGVLEWQFSTSEGFDFLGKGEQITLTYTIQVSDEHADDTQEVVIVIEGANDRPTIKTEEIIDFHRNDHQGDPANAIDADDFDNNGTLVSDLIRAQQEDLDVFGSLQGIAVQGVQSTFTTTGAEDWEFSTDGGVTWTAFDADLSAENATVLSTDARVRFVPDSDGQNTGWAQLRFVLWDQTDGNPSGTTGVDSTQLFVFDDEGEIHSEAAFGQDMLYFTVQVNAPAADAPTAVADNFEVTAGSVTTLGSLLANDIDPDTLNGDLTASVIGDPAGVTVFTDGTFTFDSTGLLPGQSFSFQYLVSDGTSSDIGTATIFVTEAAVTIDGPEDVLVGKGENIFTAAPNGLGDLTVQTWTVDGVAVASGSSFTFDPDGPGTFVLTYTAIDSSGGIASGSVTVTAVSAAIVDGDLVIGGTDGNDSITVNVVGSDYQVNVNGDISTFAIADVTGDIIICGHDGDDDIRVAPGVTQSTQIFAGSGDDTVFGGGGRDVVEAGLGNDTVFGRGGNDRLLGEDGDDTLEGNAGDDVIVTGDGTDTAVGGLGNDNLLGGGGADTLEGSAGNDELFGGDGDDDLSGGTGDDVVLGQQGNDIVDGDAGNDTLVGGAGDDTINGGAGDDEISGQSGDDTIFGMSGVDIIDGGSGNDTIVAGAGNDIVNGGLGDDVIRGNGGSDLIFGDGGDDDLIGGNQDDQILGGTGNDVLYGNSGDDTLDGGAGDDTLFGVQGDDTLTGGAGIDVLNGGFGIDTSIDVGETEILIEL